MEFEDQDEEHEEQEEEEEDIIPIASYDPVLPNSLARPLKMSTQSPVPGGGEATSGDTHNETRSTSSSPPPSPLSLSIPLTMTRKKPAARYRECLKNHAVGIGGHAVDGCGEFMPAGAEGTIDGLKCAACNCHRNFHRKEVDPTAQDHPIAQNHHHQVLTPISYYPQHQHPHPIFQFHPYSRTSPVTGGGYQQRLLALPSTSGGSRGGGGEQEGEMMISNPMAAMGLGSSGKKRFRTKFTAEQKEKMLELAERIGWRFQKQDESLIQQFCQETGLKRQVLKVWMHNNKNTLGKKP